MSMAEASRTLEGASKKKRRPRKPSSEHKKLPRLPQNAAISKRPLHRPAIPSPYAGVSLQKVVYVSTNTPFLSAVKRVEKLLHLSDKRLVQSATTLAQQQQQWQQGTKRKRGNIRSEGDEDEIVAIAAEVERQRAKRRKAGSLDGGELGQDAGEEVVLKGTGKAIQRVLELGLWFQQRDEYAVRLRTGTARAVDDIEVNEATPGETTAVNPQAEGDSGLASGDGADHADIEASSFKPSQEASNFAREAADMKRAQTDETAVPTDAIDPTNDSMATDNHIPETRIRYTSVLEVYVSLR